MPLKIWDRLNQAAGFLAIVVLFGVVFIVGGKEIGDGDTVFHIKSGEYILQHGSVPTKEVFTCSINGKTWNNHEWLFQIMLQNGFRWNGFDGVVAIQRCLLLSIFVTLLFYGYRKDRQMAVLTILLFILLVYRSRSLIRADNVSLLFSLLYLGILLFHLKRKWVPAVLGFIQLIWVNMHGFFIFGPIFVGIALSGEWLKRHVKLPYAWNTVGRLTDEEYRRLRWVGLITVAVCFINPQFVKGALYPLWVIKESAGDSKFFFDYIKELGRPFTWSSFMDQAGYPHYKVLLIISGASFLFNLKKLDIRLLVIWAIFAWFSLVAVRNLVFFAAIAGVIFMINIKEIQFRDLVPVEFTDQKFKLLLATILKVFLIVWIFNYGKGVVGRKYYDVNGSGYKKVYSGGITLNSFPHKAANFLIDNKVKGNFFNNMGSGAYLISRVAPDIKVFIDGRTEVFGAKFFQIYRKIYELGNQPLFEDAVKRLNITGVFLTSVKKELPVSFLRYLYSHPDWKLVYLDHDAVIFLKNTLENGPLIARYGIDLNSWKPSPEGLARLETNQAEIVPYYKRALTLARFGFNDQALSELTAALQIYPLYSKAYKLLGDIELKRGLDDQALYYYQVTALNQPGNMKRRLDVAKLYDRVGDAVRALTWANKTVEGFPKNAEGHFFLSMLLAKGRQYEESSAALTQALALNPRAGKPVLPIGDAAYANNDYDQAQKFYQIALKNQPRLADAYYKLGLTYLKQGNSLMAKAIFQKGLHISPHHENLQKALQDSSLGF